MKQGEPVWVARRKTSTVRCLQALTLAPAVGAGAASNLMNANAAVIVRDRQSTAIASATTGFGCCAPTSETDFDPKVTDRNAPDFNPFNESASANASVTFDNRPDGGQAFFSGSAVSTVSQNSRLRFNATSNELSGAVFSAQATASASGSGNVFNADSRSSGTADFNLIFDVTGSPAVYTLRGSAMGDPVRDDGELRLARVDLPPGAFNRFPPTLSRINVFDLADGSGPFDFTGQLDVGTYQLFATMSGRAGGLSGPPGSARFNLDLEFEDIVREMRWVGPNGGAAPADGSFQVAGNWSAPIVPGPADVAVFDLPGTYTVDLDQDVTNKRLRANGTGVNISLDLNGNDYLLDTISVGGLEGDSVSLAFDDSSGPVSVPPAGSGEGPAPAPPDSETARLRVALVNAGKGGFADVKIPIATRFGQILGGGKVNVRTSKGKWEVEELSVGIGDSGLLDVFDGGSMKTKQVLLGKKDFVFLGSADVDVQGRGTVWDSEKFVVGDAGEAVLNIGNDALVTAHEIVIGQLEGSSGVIRVSDASLLQGRSASERLTVGYSGSGALEVKNAALVEARSLRINSSFSPGSLSPGNGRVTVESLGELRVDGDLEIGKSGTGRLTINGGAQNS